MCRELGISEVTYYIWKSKYRSVEASDLMSDALWDGRGFRTLDVIGHFSREVLYNRKIPHDSLGGLMPAEFRQQNDPATSGYGRH